MDTVIAIAEGSEEMEVVVTADTLRRAGWDVTVTGIEPGPVRCSRGVRIVPDAYWPDIRPARAGMIILPGGLGGVQRLCAYQPLLDDLRDRIGEQRTGAICAGPLVLQQAGLLDGRQFTCHPAVAGDFRQGTRLDRPVVVDGNLVTSQGPGTCLDFALTLIAEVDGPGKAAGVAEPMIARRVNEYL